MKHTIIGGGIGGLTLALLLEKKGFNVEIYEQAESFQPIGAGIILAINAMKVYTHLGIHEQIEHHGIELSEMNITNPSFDILSKTDFSNLKSKFQTKTIAIHRAQLQNILLKNLSTTQIHLGKKLKSINKLKDEYELTFQNGDVIKRKMLIGADGLRSKVRHYIFPNSNIRNGHQACWRGVTSFKLSTFQQNKLLEAWGKKVRFGFVPIDNEKVYWYALKSTPSNEKPIFDFNNMFKNFNPLVTELIKSTPQNSIHYAQIEDLLPMKNWYYNSICLLGDAAHATTPNMGQGACQAIEDAYVLSEKLSTENIKNAFSEYQQERYSKASTIVKNSWRIGKISHLSNPILVTLRDTIMKLTPSSVGQKQLENIFN
ncbi:FAD-dependent monooxygenase [Tenacibaculum xiamenense]|uniref:FAD-dependent monooxygenase n=1 Tax=Tenacibaculum xiamenense TaxID=1261553 RepID=UPI0038955163